MKTILNWSISCLLFFLLSCNKDDQYQTSTWSVNNDTFSTKDYSIGIGKARASFESTNYSNNVRIIFYLSYFPSNGIWPINLVSNQNPNKVYVNFYYNNKFYTMSSHEDSYLTATKKNKKASYRLEPTWYVNYDNAEDSVLIQGTFNEPKI